MSRKKKILAEQEQEKPVPKKKDYMIAVTEDEYDAHREELEKLDMKRCHKPSRMRQRQALSFGKSRWISDRKE